MYWKMAELPEGIIVYFYQIEPYPGRVFLDLKVKCVTVPSLEHFEEWYKINKKI